MLLETRQLEGRGWRTGKWLLAPTTPVAAYNGIKYGQFSLTKTARYPGCACDVPSHSYTLTFEPNPEWSGFYAFGSEIQAYFQKFYEKYELQPYMKFDTKVLSAVWYEDKGECMWLE